MGGIIETQLFINNKLVPASDKATFDLYSPHTGEVVAKGTKSS
jgi:aldehyde dehydrogenase (NAD+)